MAADLTTIIKDLSIAEKQLLDVEKNIAGLEISVTDLKSKMQKISKSTKSSDEEKREAQADYVAEQEKLKEQISQQEELENRVVNLRRQKVQLLNAIKTEETEARAGNGAAYEVLRPRDTNMQGSAVSQIPEYNGSFGADAESFVKLIDRTKEQYNWLSRPTAYMVRSKLTGSARIFIDNQEREMLPGIDEWDGPVPGGMNLRQMLLEKFSLPITAAAATNAVEELKQEQQETVDSFYERTRFAVDKLLFSVAKTTPEQKLTYQTLFQTQVYIFFKAGLLPSYRTRIFSAATTQIPTTAKAVLEAARNAEREVNAGKKVLTPKMVCQLDYGNPNPSSQEEMETREARNADKQLSTSISGESNDSKTLEVETLKLQVEELQRQFRGQGGRGRRGFRGGRNRGGRGARGGQGQRGGQNFRGQRGRGGRGRGQGRPDLGCFNCGQMGHWADACPEPRASEAVRKEIEQRKMWSLGDIEEIGENEEDVAYLNE